MNLAELEKIVSDGKNKFKAFEDADLALSQLKATAQLEKELVAKNEALKAEGEKLEKENAKAKNKVAEVDALIDEKLLAAEKYIADTKAKATANAENVVAAAHAELGKVNASIEAAKKEAIAADAVAKESNAKADAAIKRLEEVQAELKRLIG